MNLFWRQRPAKSVETKAPQTAKSLVSSPNSARNEWPKMACAVNNAGQRLHAQYGEAGIAAEELQREAERLGGYKTGSVCPSDYCYNAINRASCSFTHPVLVRLEHGRYKYVGPNYAYEGAVFWKPKGETERQVGHWQAGICTLTEDPRKTGP